MLTNLSETKLDLRCIIMMELQKYADVVYSEILSEKCVILLSLGALQS